MREKFQPIIETLELPISLIHWCMDFFSSFHEISQFWVILGLITLCLVFKDILIKTFEKIFSSIKLYWIIIFGISFLSIGIISECFIGLFTYLTTDVPEERLQLFPLKQGNLVKAYPNQVYPGHKGRLVKIQYQLPPSSQPLHIKIVVSDKNGTKIILDRQAKLDENIALQMSYYKEGQLEIYLDNHLDWVEPLEDYFERKNVNYSGINTRASCFVAVAYRNRRVCYGRGHGLHTHRAQASVISLAGDGPERS